jgi:hypothetical protein
VTDEKLIEEAAKAVYNNDPSWGYVYEDDHSEHAADWEDLGDDLRDKFRTIASGVLAVFGKAHTPTDDEREALFRALDGLVPDGIDHRDAVDAVLAAGFRRTAQGEPTDAQVEAALVAYWGAMNVDWYGSRTGMRAALRAAAAIEN